MSSRSTSGPWNNPTQKPGTAIEATPNTVAPLPREVLALLAPCMAAGQTLVSGISQL